MTLAAKECHLTGEQGLPFMPSMLILQTSTAIRTAGFCSCWHVRECNWLFSTINADSVCAVCVTDLPLRFFPLCLHLLSLPRSFVRSLGRGCILMLCLHWRNYLTDHTSFSNPLYCPFLNKLRLSALFALPFLCQKSKANFSQTRKSILMLFVFSFLKWMAWGWKPKGVLPTARQQSILVRTAGNGSPTDTTEENTKICRNGKKVIHTEWEAVQDEWWKLLFSLMWNEVIIGAKISAAHRWYFLVQLRTFCESKRNLYPDCLSVYVAVLLGCSGDQAVRSVPPSALGCLLHLREAKAASRRSTWVATNCGATDMPEQQQVVTLPAGHPTSQVRH